MSDKRPPHPVITRLLSKFGTQTAIAAAIGVKPHTICGKQANANPLTYAQMERLLERAPELGVDLAPSDLFPRIAANSDPETKAA
jgi:hypothetical protein